VTQIDKEAAERWNCWIDDLPLDKSQWTALDELQQFIRTMAAALDAAEARERAAVAAAYRNAAETDYQWWDDDDAQDLREHIRALSDTDALAEWEKKVREEGFWAGRSCGGSRAQIDAALAAIRQETNDG
jgi:hypothetical protein